MNSQTQIACTKQFVCEVKRIANPVEDINCFKSHCNAVTSLPSGHSPPYMPHHCMGRTFCSDWFCILCMIIFKTFKLPTRRQKCWWPRWLEGIMGVILWESSWLSFVGRGAAARRNAIKPGTIQHHPLWASIPDLNMADQQEEVHNSLKLQAFGKGTGGGKEIHNSLKSHGLGVGQEDQMEAVRSNLYTSS